MTDPIVTHADLATVQLIDLAVRGSDFTDDERRAVTDLLDRARAAAEADVPPLPEGWVLLDDNMVLWHRVGILWFTKAEMKAWGPVWSHRDRLSPLRPTVTEADVEKALDAFLAAYEDVRGNLRAAFAAAGVVIEP